MNKDIMIAAGFKDEVELVAEGKCPFCRSVITEKSFRDELSKREFKISGLCQVCQDKTFGFES